MTFNFTLPERANVTLANEGVNFETIDEFGNPWGTFKMIWMDTESQRGAKKIERARRKYQSALKNKTMTDDEFMIRLLVENYLVDWDLPEAITGKKVFPFSHEAALALLSMENARWLVVTLLQKSADITNFGAVIDSEGESIDPEKN